MLQVSGDPKRIDRAIKRLHGALKGVPARGVRLTWRGADTLTWAIHQHGAMATLLGLSAVGVWFLARAREIGRAHV